MQGNLWQSPTTAKSSVKKFHHKIFINVFDLSVSFVGYPVKCLFVQTYFFFFFIQFFILGFFRSLMLFRHYLVCSGRFFFFLLGYISNGFRSILSFLEPLFHSSRNKIYVYIKNNAFFTLQFGTNRN